MIKQEKLILKNMIKEFFMSILLIVIGQIAFSQCIDKEKIKTGYLFGNRKHHRVLTSDTITYTEVYAFDENGKVYDSGNYVVNDAIDIKLAVADAKKYNHKLKNTIRAYVDEGFFLKTSFKIYIRFLS